VAEEFRVLLGKYTDTQPQKYNATQPRDKRKKGFLSGDARKRDMAMNTTMGTIMGETFLKVCLPSLMLAIFFAPIVPTLSYLQMILSTTHQVERVSPASVRHICAPWHECTLTTVQNGPSFSSLTTRWKSEK